MASDSYTLEVIADISKYAEKVAKIPGITEKQVAAATLKFQSRLFQVQKAAEKADKKGGGFFSGLAEGADKAGERAEKLRGALDLASPSAGALAGVVADLGDALTVLASPTGIVVGSLGALALAGAGAGAAMVASAFAADEALASLEGFRRIGSDFYPRVPPATLESIKQLNASGDALASIFRRATVALGSELAPTLETVANVTVGAALVAEELFEQFLSGVDIVDELAVRLGTKLVAAATVPLKPLVRLAEGILLASRAAGIDLPDGAEAALGKLANLNRTVAEGAVSFVREGVAGSKLGDTLAGLEARGAAFIRTQRRATAAMGEEEKETYDLVAALTRLEDQAQRVRDSRLTGAGALRAERDRELASIDAQVSAEAQAAVEKGATWQDLASLFAQAEITKAEVVAETERKIQALQDATRTKFLAGMDEAAAKQVAKLRQVEAARAALVESMEAYNRRQNDAIVAGFDQSLSAISDLSALAAQETAESNAEVANRYFVFSQAAAISQAVINGFVAATRALAELGPIAGPIAAAGVGVTTAALVAQIAAQDPPSFHSGGVLSGVPDLAPDERLVVARPGEGWLTSRGVREAGGPSGVAALNQGRGSVSPSVRVDLRVTGRTAQRLVQVGSDEPTRKGRPGTGQRDRNRRR